VVTVMVAAWAVSGAARTAAATDPAARNRESGTSPIQRIRPGAVKRGGIAPAERVGPTEGP